MDNSNMLGIYIEYTHEGTHELMSYNSNPSWVNLLGEITELKQIDKPVNQVWSLEVLQRIESGHIIRVVCPNAGRNDYICASIYVPWNVVISGKELSDVVSKTEKEIISWKKETSKSLLTELFSKKYDVVDLYKEKYSEDSVNIAYRYYGVCFQLHELLDNIDQPYYSNYKYVFLINNKFNISFKLGADLSKEKLVETTIIRPPGDVDGFVPHIGSSLFNKPVRRNIGDSLTLSWIRPNFKTIDKTTKVTQNGTNVIRPQVNEYEREIPFSDIKVYNENNQQLENDKYYVSVNGKNLKKGGAKVYVNNASLKDVRIHVVPKDTDSYEVSDGKYNLSNGGPCNVHLKRVRLTYEFSFPLKNGDSRPATFIFEERLNSCPFKDYNVRGDIVTKEGGCNDLKLNLYSKARVIKFSIFLFVILVLGIVVGCYFTNMCYEKNIDKYYQPQNLLLNNKLKQEETTDLSKAKYQNWEQVINYLDKNPVWERSAMEKFDEIRGLWDAINQWEFENILQYEEDIKKSSNFTRLVNAIKNNKRQFDGAYCVEGDTKITIDAYINKLEPIVLQPTAPQPTNDKNTRYSQNDWK